MTSELKRAEAAESAAVGALGATDSRLQALLMKQGGGTQFRDEKVRSRRRRRVRACVRGGARVLAIWHCLCTRKTKQRAWARVYNTRACL